MSEAERGIVSRFDWKKSYWKEASKCSKWRALAGELFKASDKLWKYHPFIPDIMVVLDLEAAIARYRHMEDSGK